MISKKYRLERRNIEYLLRKGDTLFSNNFIVKYSKNTKDFPRFCVIISKKCSKKAVERNKWRRRTYEAIRNSIKSTNTSNDYVIIAKKNILTTNYRNIENDILSLLTKTSNE